MEDTLTQHQKNVAAAIHASTFSRFFIPFGNFILPLVLWMANRNDNTYVDYHGKSVLNFQMSMLLYSLILGILALPFSFGLLAHLFDIDFFDMEHINGFMDLNIHFRKGLQWGHWFFPLGIVGITQVALFIVNLLFSILGALDAHNGSIYKYPLSIRFIK